MSEKSSRDSVIGSVNMGRDHQVFTSPMRKKRARERAKQERERYAQLCGDVTSRSMTRDEFLRYGVVAEDEEGRLYVPKKKT